jgi:hypothetical protein
MKPGHCQVSGFGLLYNTFQYTKAMGKGCAVLIGLLIVYPVVPDYRRYRNENGRDKFAPTLEIEPI